MDIKGFRTFVSVSENKHFGRAAEQLYITQAAVSARIKQLEEYYSTPLFIREKNNLMLTPAGEALLPFAHLIIEQLAQSKIVVNMASEQKSSFNIAATPNVWDAFLSRRVHDINHLFDSVVVGTEISVREVIQRKLDDKSLNIAFLTDPIKESDFNNALIGYFDIALVGTEPRFNDEVDNYIYMDWGITFAKEHANTHKVFPSHRTSTAVIALEIILSSGGFAYLPTESIDNYITEGRLYKVESSLQIKRPVYLVYRKGCFVEERIKTLINFLGSNQ
jgi:LysR family transcriptional regulator, flagellar master operon regulator